MVQNELTSSINEEEVIKNPPTIKSIPLGNYRLVGWGIDTTGKRLIDEICQIAVYTPVEQFSQYIMPYSDLNFTFRRKHNIRIVNSGKYRMLKDMRSNKFVKTKSAISALNDFIKWLENINSDDGIILIYHEIPKASPGMLLEVLRRHDLLDRFSKVVKGFVNGYNIAQAKCAKTTKAFTLRVMSKVLLGNENEDFSSAVDRAKASFNIIVHLAQGEREDLGTNNIKEYNGNETELIEFIYPFISSIDAEEEEIANFKVLLERQNTFKPVFGALLKASPSERQHASHLRRLLAENNINYEKLKIAYENGAKDGIDKLLKTEIANAKEKELNELLDILDCFFDPEKKAIQPKPRPYQNNRLRRRSTGRKLSTKDKTSASESNSSPNASSDNHIETTTTTTTESAKIEIKNEEISKAVEVQ